MEVVERARHKGRANSRYNCPTFVSGHQWEYRVSRSEAKTEIAEVVQLSSPEPRAEEIRGTSYFG